MNDIVDVDGEHFWLINPAIGRRLSFGEVVDRARQTAREILVEHGVDPAELDDHWSQMALRARAAEGSPVWLALELHHEANMAVGLLGNVLPKPAGVREGVEQMLREEVASVTSASEPGSLTALHATSAPGRRPQAVWDDAFKAEMRERAEIIVMIGVELGYLLKSVQIATAKEGASATGRKIRDGAPRRRAARSEQAKRDQREGWGGLALEIAAEVLTEAAKRPSRAELVRRIRRIWPARTSKQLPSSDRQIEDLLRTNGF